MYVAGQPAYQLVVGPEGAAGSSIRNIEVALGTSGPLLGVPLQIAIYTNGQATPALELGLYRPAQHRAPPASKLTFTAPPGSSGSNPHGGCRLKWLRPRGFDTPDTPDQDVWGGRTVPRQACRPALGSGLGELSKSGTGWSTVVSGSSGPLFGSIAAPLSAVTTVVTVHGQQGGSSVPNC